MGSRGSHLRNRQQVQDSSQVVANLDNCCASNIKQVNGAGLGNSNSNIGCENNNNNNNVVDDVTKIKAALNQNGSQILQESGPLSNRTQQQMEVQLAPNGNSNGKGNKNNNNSNNCQPSKVSTLQRQASHIQSLAQRIRRSSSLRAPKLRGLIPSFVSGKRKVSFTRIRFMNCCLCQNSLGCLRASVLSSLALTLTFSWCLCVCVFWRRRRVQNG